MGSVFGERLARILGERDMSNAALARQCGIHPNTIGVYVAGSHEPTAGKVAAISKALGVSADWLLGLTEEDAR